MRSVLESIERTGPRGLARADAVRLGLTDEAIRRLVAAGLVLPCYRVHADRRRPTELVYHAIK